MQSIGTASLDAVYPLQTPVRPLDPIEWVQLVEASDLPRAVVRFAKAFRASCFGRRRNEVRVGRDVVALRLTCDPRTVRRNTAALAAAGWLSFESKGGRACAANANLYRLTTPGEVIHTGDKMAGDVSPVSPFARPAFARADQGRGPRVTYPHGGQNGPRASKDLKPLTRARAAPQMPTARPSAPLLDYASIPPVPPDVVAEWRARLVRS